MITLSYYKRFISRDHTWIQMHVIIFKPTNRNKLNIKKGFSSMKHNLFKITKLKLSCVNCKIIIKSNLNISEKSDDNIIPLLSISYMNTCVFYFLIKQYNWSWLYYIV